MVELLGRRASLSLFVVFVLGPMAAARGQDQLIANGDTWAYFKGTEEPPATWNQLTFNDATWLQGQTPIGYSADLPYKTTLDEEPWLLLSTQGDLYRRLGSPEGR